MSKHSITPWDYLIVTASNDAQARAYESQLKLRHRLGYLPNVRHVLVVADPEGKRVGSGGSTLCCLMEVVNRELAGQTARASSLVARASSLVARASSLVARASSLVARASSPAGSPGVPPGVRSRGGTPPKPAAEDGRATPNPGSADVPPAGSPGVPPGDPIESILRRLRILIIHAGGDSRRLPAYGPCGKIFIPVPGRGDPAPGCALFDRIAPHFMSLPPGREGCGQIVMAAGDALILFDPSNVSLAFPGLTALACPDTPEHASKHGVFCAGGEGRVRLYLQKPDPAEQRRHRAIRQGRTLLDIGIMSFDNTLALALLRAFGIKPGRDGQLAWPARMKREVLARGVDFFREICCAMGGEATAAHHREQAQGAGSSWSGGDLEKMFRTLQGVPFHLQTIPQARFLHFGTTRQLITSGAELRQHDQPRASATQPLSLNNDLRPGGRITVHRGRVEVSASPRLRVSFLGAPTSWVEGCRIDAPLELAGQNVVIGVEVAQPLALPEQACLDVLRGRNRAGRKVWFVRGYGLGDTFKDTAAKGGTFCGQPLLDWLAALGAKPEDIWDRSVPADKRSLWDARVFPAEAKPAGYRKWLWVFDPTRATPEQKQAFLAADRYSAAEVAVRADQDDFFARRRRVRREAARMEN